MAAKHAQFVEFYGGLSSGQLTPTAAKLKRHAMLRDWPTSTVIGPSARVPYMPGNLLQLPTS